MRGVLTSLVFCGAFHGAALASAEPPIWTFEGRFGPQFWGDIDSDYRACSDGRDQSPIDLASAYDTTLEPPRPDWDDSGWKVVNSGNMIEMQHDDGGTTRIMGQDYALRRILFRRSSEHAIGGRRFPMEVQFVHHAEDGRQVVLSVMIAGGGQNPTLERIAGNAPLNFSDPPVEVRDIELASLLGDLTDQFIYRGSLSYPPCTEGVLWVVLMDPVAVSNAALLAFDALHAPNARPIQPLNGRFILTD